MIIRLSSSLFHGEEDGVQVLEVVMIVGIAALIAAAVIAIGVSLINWGERIIIDALLS